MNFMMNYLNLRLQLKYRTVIKGLLVMVLSAAVFSGCNKPEDIGLGVVALPGEQLNVNFTDTVTINTYSIIIDSVPTKSASNQMLGAIFDPVFGSSAAGIYTQVRLLNNDLDFGTNAVCDSIIFGLEYIDHKGGPNNKDRPSPSQTYRKNADIHPENMTAFFLSNTHHKCFQYKAQLLPFSNSDYFLNLPA